VEGGVNYGSKDSPIAKEVGICIGLCRNISDYFLERSVNWVLYLLSFESAMR
jgi:hypothetical protein